MPGTRDRLLTATIEVLRRGGYHRTSVKEVADAAGVTNGSLYHHFPGGKVELAATALRVSGRAYQELFDVAAADADGPAEAVTVLFDGAATTLEETGFADMCPIGTVAGEVASAEEALRQACDDVFGSWVAQYAAQLSTAGIEAAEATRLATSTVATLEGAFTLARTRRDGDVMRDAGTLVREVLERRLAAIGVRD